MNFDMLRTRVRLPPSPPSNKDEQTDEVTDEQLEIVYGGMRKHVFDVYSTDLINNHLLYNQRK